MDFGQRLKQLLDDRDLKQIDFARHFQLGKSTISQYISGERTPDLDTVRRFADFFGVSTDYLLGRTGDPTPPGAKPRPEQPPTNQEFRAFLRGRKLSDKDIELILQLEERMRRESEEKKKGQD